MQCAEVLRFMIKNHINLHHSQTSNLKFKNEDAITHQTI